MSLRSIRKEACLPVFRMEVTKRRYVFKAVRESQRQLARRGDLAKEDIRDGVARRIAQVPCVHEASNRLRPGHGDCGPLQSTKYTISM